MARRSHLRLLDDLEHHGVETKSLFALDLINSPAKQILHCAQRRHPVNPFSFMVFGGLIYTAVAGLGVTVITVIKASLNEHCRTEVLQLAFETVPQFLLVLALSLIFNTIPFRIFRYFSPLKRSFDDFMRLMAAVNGLFWMLLAFLTLFLNEQITTRHMVRLHCNSLYNANAGNPVFLTMTYILSVIIFFYINITAIIVQKHFWSISYLRTIGCYIATVFVLALAILIIFSPIILTNFLKG